MTVDDASGKCSYHFTYDDAPSEAAINAVAWLNDRDPTDLEPLYAVIDPDALDEAIDSAVGSDLSVEFRYEGCVVTIVSGGDLYARSTPDLNCGHRDTASAVLLLDESLNPSADPPKAVRVPPVSIEDSDTLVITFSADAVEEWRDVMALHSTDRSVVGRILLAGDFTRSGGAQLAETKVHSNDLQLDTVPDPTNLTAIGLLIAHFLEECESRDNRPVVCFQSITELLQHVSLQKTYHFLTLVLSRLRLAGAAGYFYLDPAAHDEQTRLTLESLFDTVASRTTDGGWVVQAE